MLICFFAISCSSESREELLTSGKWKIDRMTYLNDVREPWGYMGKNDFTFNKDKSFVLHVNWTQAPKNEYKGVWRMHDDTLFVNCEDWPRVYLIEEVTNSSLKI